MVVWFLVTLLMTAQGVPAADIPRPFTTRAECTAEGLKRSAEIVADKTLKNGIWACLDANFEQNDPIPPTPQEPGPPLSEHRNG